MLGARKVAASVRGNLLDLGSHPSKGNPFSKSEKEMVSQRSSRKTIYTCPVLRVPTSKQPTSIQSGKCGRLVMAAALNRVKQ